MPIRLKILIANLAITLVTVALGLYFLQGERMLGGTALKMYDNAFMSVNFARSAQTKFAEVKTLSAIDSKAEAQAAPELSERQRLLAVARGGSAASSAIAAPGPDKAALRTAVGSVLEDLDVAIERAMSDDTLKLARQLREKIAALANGADTAALRAASSAFDDTIESFAQDGYKFRQDAEAGMASHLRWTKLAIALSIGLGLLFTALLAQSIVPALRHAAAVAQAVAMGRLDNEIRLPRRVGRSETARLLVALSRMQARIARDARDKEMSAAEQEAMKLTAAQKTMMNEMADAFESKVGDLIPMLSSAATELQATAHVMTSTATETNQQAASVRDSAEEASAGVQTVAAAAEELGA